ncbi:MAG: nucleotidyltransferase domain-containing protein [Methanosarcina sp.]|uniref:type VII toxin-antitoxin system MntA family adenylyltransferase antitoxin n=1 Tax=Methanosarcina sp. TaxID=2213 RepID=UPI0026185394|nr:nucleotidyltransferase domain-containing protein [Methanosarcina sp.]MDD3245566.1 nucleotidyltransferase domain-containing protein [Methanosarcina sp.]MDD4248730.1 nucleotidyltransferase domain-containing protein [Methanosarcina sp.]
MGTEILELEGRELTTKLNEFFQKVDYVELAYLFGSHAKGKQGPLSDIDIGVYLSGNLSKKERFEKRLELIASLCTLLQTNKVDLVVMNDASPVLNFEIIEPNCLVFEKDHSIKLKVEPYIMSGYCDRKYHEDFLNREFVKRFKEKGFA